MRAHTVYLTYSLLSLGSALAVAVSMGVWMDALPSPWFVLLGLATAFLTGLSFGCRMAWTSHLDAYRQRQVEDASCAACAAMVIQSGICRVVAPLASPELLSRWKADLDLAELMYVEAGVELVLPARLELLEAEHGKG